MAFYYKRGHRFYFGYKDEKGQWHKIPMRQDDGRIVLEGGNPVFDEKHAQYLIKEYENGITRGEAPYKFDAGRRIDDVIPEYAQFVRGTIGPKQFKEEAVHLKLFSEYLNNKSVASIEMTSIKDFVYSRTKKFKGKVKEVSDRTKNSYLVTLKKFFKFSHRKEYINNNPALYVQLKRLPQIKPTWLENGQDDILLRYAKANQMEYPYYYAAIAVGRYNGLRIKELIYLEWKDITWGRRGKNGTLTVQNKMNFRTKNLEYRTIPLSSKAEEILKPLQIPGNSGKKGYCFWPEDSRRLSYEHHRKVFKKMAREAKIELPAQKVWHILRHTFATKHARAGRSDLKLAKWLGHNSLEMVKRYSHLDAADQEIDNAD